MWFRYAALGESFQKQPSRQLRVDVRGLFSSICWLLESLLLCRSQNLLLQQCLLRREPSAARAVTRRELHKTPFPVYKTQSTSIETPYVQFHNFLQNSILEYNSPSGECYRPRWRDLNVYRVYEREKEKNTSP